MLRTDVAAAVAADGPESEVRACGSPSLPPPPPPPLRQQLHPTTASSMTDTQPPPHHHRASPNSVFVRCVLLFAGLCLFCALCASPLLGCAQAILLLHAQELWDAGKPTSSIAPVLKELRGMQRRSHSTSGAEQVRSRSPSRSRSLSFVSLPMPWRGGVNFVRQHVGYSTGGLG